MSIADGGSGDLLVMDEPASPDPEPTPVDGKRRKRLLIALAILGVLLLLLGAIFAWYLITRKPLSHLPGINTWASPTYKTSIYGVDQPIGVALSVDGQHVYVTQTGGTRTTLEFDKTGNLLATLQPPKSTGAGHVPVYVAVNPTNGDVYVSDRMALSIYVYSADGKYVRTFKPDATVGNWAPLGLAFDKSGKLYVTDVGGKTHRVLVFDTTGVLQRTLAPTDLAMSFPNGVAVDEAGNVIVTDGNNGRLLAFDASGKVIASVNRGIGNGDLGMPRGVAIDADGRLYVVDTTNQEMHVYKLGDPGSNKVDFLGRFGTEGIQDGQFEYPNGIAVDGRSDIYITDRENGRVQVWSP